MATLEDTLIADVETVSYDDLDSVSKLQKSQRYAHIMQKVEETLRKDSDGAKKGTVLEHAPEYNKLIVDCNQLSFDIDKEIVIVHNFIRDKYRPKFPELESLVHHPIEYARVVKRIGNATDLTLVDLEGLLQPAVIMVVSVTALTTKGNPLPEDVLQKTIDACDRALDFDAARKKVRNFVESKMGSTAPNLTARSALTPKTAGGFGLRMCSSGTLAAEYQNVSKSTLAAGVDSTRGGTHHNVLSDL